MIHDIWTNPQHLYIYEKKKKSIFKTVELVQVFLPGRSWGSNATLQPPTWGSHMTNKGQKALNVALALGSLRKQQPLMHEHLFF